MKLKKTFLECAVIAMLLLLIVPFAVSQISPENLDDAAFSEWVSNNSCSNLGGEQVCNEFQECMGTSLWNTSDYSGENCCVGFCRDITKESAVKKLSKEYGPEEAQFLADSYYSTEETAAQQSVAEKEITKTGESNLAIIFIAAAIIIIIILFLIFHLRKKKQFAKLGLLILLLLCAVNFTAAQESFRFDIISDTHTTPVPNIQSILNTKPAFIVHTGDFTAGGRLSFSDYPTFASNNIPVLPLIGNHDAYESSGRTKTEFYNFWKDKKPSGISFTDDKNWPYYYSFDYGSYHFVALPYVKGQYRVISSTEALEWLKNDIAASKKPTIIFSHEPAIPVDCGAGATAMHPNDIYPGLEQAVKELSQVVAVFSGHQHCYINKEIRPGVPQIVVGTTSHDVRYPIGDSEYRSKLKGKHLFVTVDASSSGISVCPIAVETGETYGDCKVSSAQAAAQVSQFQPDPCSTGARYGGGDLSANINDQSLVTIDPALFGSRNICLASDCTLKQATLERLVLANQIAEREGCTLTIVSAHRTAEYQMGVYASSVDRLMQERQAQGKPITREAAIRLKDPYICGDGSSDPSHYAHCPHVFGGAVDFDFSGGTTTCGGESCMDSQSCREKLLKTMCEAGWINYGAEWWHFEYGTNRWKTEKERNPRICQYSSSNPLVLDHDYVQQAPAITPTVAPAPSVPLQSPSATSKCFFPSASENERKYTDYIYEKSSSYGIDPLFLKAVIQTESQWNDRIVSAPTNTPDAPTSQNSAGIMRFIPATARKYGLNVPERGYVCTQKNTAGCDYVNDERFNPEKSIEAALKYLSAIKTFLSNNNYEVTDENIYLAYFMGEDNFRKYPGRDKVPPGWTDTLNAVNNFNKNLNLIKSSCGGTGGYQTVPAGAIQLKKLSQYGGGFIVDVDPRYFDIKTLSAKTVREDIGGGDCAKYCYGNIVDLKRTVPALNIIAGINAAYLDWVGTGGISDPTQRELYEKYGRPVGDYVEDGKFIKGKYEAGFNNYFVVENGIPQITSEFSFSPSVSSAVAGARDSGVRARTVVCTTADGRVKLVVVSSSSLSALTEYLTSEEKCSKVLNLDGGGSTQFYYDYGGEKVEDAAIESPGIQTKGREVADFIVVVPKAGVSYGSPSLCPSAQFINSPEEEILYAAYRILPSFAVSVEQPLDPYVEVQETIRGALNDDAKCGKDKTPECLARNLQNSEDFNYYFKSNREYYPNNAKNDWNDYCEQGQEEFFADFAEFFDLCINAEQGCSCKLTGVNTNALGSESIKFTKVSEARYDASLLGYDDLIFYTPYLSKFPVEIKSGFTFVYPNEQKTLSTVYINKKGNQLEFSSAPTGPVCKNIESSMVKVCVVSKNPVSEEKHLVFRFAFEPEAVPPPDVNNVQAQDLQRAKQSILVSWDGSTAKNVVAYNIYAQNSEFKGKESEKIKESLAGLQPTRLETINSQDVKKINDVVPICSPAGVKSCIFDFNVTSESSGIEVNSKIRASPQTLIHESDTNKYYYILETEDGVLAYYGVTAINKKELESLGFLETPAAVSVDDIPPGHVYTTQTPVDDTVTLDWARPGNNIDGSELSPTASLNYALYSMCGAATEFTEYGLETPSTQVLQLPKDCSYKVIAKKAVQGKLIPLKDKDADIIKYLLE